MIESNNRAIVLFVALSTLIIVVILANILIRIVLSQSWFTKHHQSRIQAHYAGLAGLNYAFEKLRTGDPNWPATGDYTHKICRSGCNNPGDMNDSDLPFAIHSVNIHVFGADAGIPGTKTRKVQIAVKYSMWGS